MLFPADAACRNCPTDLFMPHENGRTYPFEGTAKDLCAVCPVTAECLDDALRHPDMTIRAGLLPRERDVVAGARRVEWRPPVLATCGTDAAYARHIRNEGAPVTCELCLRAHRLTTAYRASQRGGRVRVG